MSALAGHRGACIGRPAGLEGSLETLGACRRLRFSGPTAARRLGPYKSLAPSRFDHLPPLHLAACRQLDECSADDAFSVC